MLLRDLLREVAGKVYVGGLGGLGGFESIGENLNGGVGDGVREGGGGVGYSVKGERGGEEEREGEGL